MAHGLNLSRLERTGATEAGGHNGAPHCTVENHANRPIPGSLKSNARLEQNWSRLERSGADQLVAPVLQLAPLKGGITGSELEHPDQLPRTGAEQDWQAVWIDPDAYYDGPVDADLSEANWADSLPAILSDAQSHFAGQADIEVMRDHYRCADKPTRALIASIMGAR